MNDEILAQQLAKTGNLLDLLNDEAWVRETEAIEAECGGQVEAGLGLKAYVEQLATVPSAAFRQQRRQVQLLSILLPELKAWLQSWELGRIFEAVYIEAQRQLFEHLQRPTPEQVIWLDSLLAEDSRQISPEQKTVRSQAIVMLVQMFTEDDWQALAQTAAEETARGILQVRHRQLHQQARQTQRPG
ncbi:hypothetical protein [Leptolyngbya sp. PCC 6406]|uniref:hypothetical protein n=1 Tax=Leptolyngbya sp. PCC 6406 TaxID=1173264 RepID=UPI0002E3CF57|nr:hypothetical protein [Leptolyngbya sp. PCC 6406]